MRQRRRRSVLAAIGSVALAGCSQSTDQGSGDGGSRRGRSIGTEQGIGDVAAEVSDLRVTSEVTIDEEYHAPEGVVFLLAKVRVTNVGDSPTDLPGEESFVVVSGSEQYDPSGVTSRFRGPVHGEAYSSEYGAHPDVSSEGWIVFELPRDLENGVIGWSHQRTWDPDSNEVRYWNLSVDLTDAANLRVVDVSAPEPAERYTNTTVTIRVENTGQREGDFETTIEAPPNEGFDTEEIDIQETVSPGKETEIEVDIPYQTGSTAEFSLSGTVYEFDYRDSVFEFGETFEIEDQVSITVDDFQTSPFLRTEIWDDPENQYPGEGNQYLIFHVDSHIQGDFAGSIGTATFEIVSPETIEAESIPGELVGPVRGPKLPTIESGASEISGYVAFSAPQNIDEEDLVIEYHDNPWGGPPISARWEHP